MNEKELLRNLNALKSVAPSSDWVKKNRELMSFQIFNGQEPVGNEFGWFANFSLAAHRFLQPAPIAALIALFFFISGGVGLRAAQKSTPNDSLYIAKIISEKVQQTATFDQSKKAELNLRFAQNRAEEMEQLAQANNASTDTATQANVSASFNNEVASVRQQLNRLNQQQAKAATIAAQTQTKAKLNLKVIAKKNDTKPAITPTEGDGIVSTANSTKDSKGLDISLPTDSRKILEEAEKLFKEKKYKDAATKLGQIQIK